MGQITPMVEMKSITKTFPGVVANDEVSLEVKRGEVHALLGENGAGKSTLMSILTGLYRPDHGEIRVKGKTVRFSGPKEAINAGIGMVHQHFKLVSPFTVAENIVLGYKGLPRLYDMGKISREIRELSKMYSLEVDPRAKIWQLSVGEQQRVEILKMLFRGVDILILDEPTAVQTPQETEELFKTLNDMKREGKAVVFITHKMNEVMSVADRITVLRNGKSIATVNKADTNRIELTRLMVGREVMLQVEKTPPKITHDRLELISVNALNDKGLPALRDVSLEIRGGEIMGVAGVAGNGQKELTEVIAGLRKVSRGKILINEKNVTNHSPAMIMASGVAFIPEDRLGMGLVQNFSCSDNMILKDYGAQPYCKRGFINDKQVKKKTQEMVEKFQIKTADLDQPVKLMSGGNLQKLLISREISRNPKFMIAAYPVRGLDVNAIETVHSILLEQKENGVAVLFISEDLDEIFKLSDRIAVLYEGKVMGVLPAGETNVEEVGLLMAGTEVAESVGG